jgi:Domain of unknown function (DUF4340)
MFNKLSPKTLAVIFVVLFVVAAFYVYYDSSHEERSFKSDIVNIDTAKITSIYIYPKATNHKEVKIFKEGKYWQVMLSNNKSVPADQGKIKNMINQLNEIKANSVAAQQESKWKEYKVDSSGTRVKVYEGGDNTLDLILGKLSYQQPRTMTTFVRVKGDQDVYEINGFLEFTFNQKPNYFRNNIVVNDDFTHWNRITYAYPDSSFQLVKDSTNHWMINNVKVDSAKVVTYLRTLSHLNGRDFIDNPDQSLLRKSNYTATIESSALGAVTLVAYVDPAQCIIHSSQNPESYFEGKSTNLWQKIFVGKSHFLKNKK